MVAFEAKSGIMVEKMMTAEKEEQAAFEQAVTGLQHVGISALRWPCGRAIRWGNGKSNFFHSGKTA